MSISPMRSKDNEPLTIRWLIQRDMDAVLEIEERSFFEPWSQKQFEYLIRQRAVIGLVIADLEANVRGHCIYELGCGDLIIHRIAIHPNFRRRGYASGLIQRMKDKCGERYDGIFISVDERNVACQVFLREQDFLFDQIWKTNDEYDDYSLRYSATTASC